MAQRFTETTTNLAISATYTGDARESGSRSAPNEFVAVALSSAEGTLSIERSDDNATWYQAASVAVTASTPASLTIPAASKYHRVKLVNGAAATTALSINSMYRS